MPKRKKEEEEVLSSDDSEDNEVAIDEDEEEVVEETKTKKSKSSNSSSPSIPTGNDARSVVLRYMLEQNRPYNNTTILNNLHGQVGKGMLEKILSDLGDEGLLQIKEFGKTKIYMAAQPDVSATSEELAAMDGEIERLTQEKSKLHESLQSLKAEISKLNSEPDDKNLDLELNSLEKEISSKSSNLEKLKRGENSLSREDVDKIQKQFNTYVQEWKKRKKGCLEFCQMFGDMSQAKTWTMKKFITDRGIDTDEACKANIEDWTKLIREVKEDPKQSKVKGKTGKK